jgi:hypothetical protein
MDNKEDLNVVVQETSQVSELQDFYTVTDIARVAGVSRQRIHQLIGVGALKPDITTSLVFIFKRKTVLNWMKGYKRRHW